MTWEHTTLALLVVPAVVVGDINQAFASMGSDLGKHEATANHAGIQLGMMMLMSGQIKSPGEMRKFIEGFN